MKRWGEKNECGEDHYPRENANWKEVPRDDVKENHSRICKRSKTIAKQEENDEQIIKTSYPTEGVCCPRLLKIAPNNWNIMMCLQPRSKWLRMKQPVAIQFCYASKTVHDRQLELNDIDVPCNSSQLFNLWEKQRIQRKITICRNKYHDEAHQTDKVVMVQIIGFIQQLHIGKTDEKNESGIPIEQSNNDEQRRNNHQNKGNIHHVPF